MRQIERQMNEAILNGKDFFKSNTSVENYITETGAREAVVKLHGNHIATVGDTLQISDAGWQTVTTKSRLNALCNEFAEGCYVFQRNFDFCAVTLVAFVFGFCFFCFFLKNFFSTVNSSSSSQ